MDVPIFKRLDVIEMEINNLKKQLKGSKRDMVSLRGLGKLKVSEKELESALSEARKSLFKV